MVRMEAGGGGWCPEGLGSGVCRELATQPAALCFLPQLFLTQLQVGLIQQVRGARPGWSGSSV